MTFVTLALRAVKCAGKRKPITGEIRPEILRTWLTEHFRQYEGNLQT